MGVQTALQGLSLLQRAGENRRQEKIDFEEKSRVLAGSKKLGDELLQLDVGRTDVGQVAGRGLQEGLLSAGQAAQMINIDPERLLFMLGSKVNDPQARDAFARGTKILQSANKQNAYFKTIGQLQAMAEYGQLKGQNDDGSGDTGADKLKKYFTKTIIDSGPISGGVKAILKKNGFDEKDSPMKKILEMKRDAETTGGFSILGHQFGVNKEKAAEKLKKVSEDEIALMTNMSVEIEGLLMSDPVLGKPEAINYRKAMANQILKSVWYNGMEGLSVVNTTTGPNGVSNSKSNRVFNVYVPNNIFFGADVKDNLGQEDYNAFGL